MNALAHIDLATKGVLAWAYYKNVQSFVFQKEPKRRWWPPKAKGPHL
jgi:hypothetical protein